MSCGSPWSVCEVVVVPYVVRAVVAGTVMHVLLICTACCESTVTAVTAGRVTAVLVWSLG